MQICPSCFHAQLDGIIFCDVCGALLPAGPSTSSQIILGPPVPYAGLSEPGLDTAPGRQGWWLHFNATGRQLILPKASELIVGRGRATRLDLNLDPEGTPAGVSHTHAVLVSSGSGWAIQDLGSTNGTYVNWSRIPTDCLTALRSGDRIHFGALLTTLRTT